MALLHCDSFDDRDILHIGDRYYQHVYNVSAGSGISNSGRTGKALILSTGILDVFDHVTWQSDTTRQTLYVGVARQFNRGAIVSIRYSGTPQIFANMNTDGTISIIRYDGGLNTILATSTQTVTTDQSVFYYCELYGKIDATNGAYELRIDGTTWLSASGLNTSSTGDNFANQVRLINNSGLADGATTLVDDFYIADDNSDSGNALITGFAGPVKIACLEENANGTVTQFTPIGATNYQAVGETSGEDADTTYVRSNVHGDTDVYGLTDIETPQITVKAVAVRQWARKEDALYRGFIPVAYVSGTPYPGSETALDATYGGIWQFYERNPATLAAWTLTEVNALEVGGKVSTTAP